MSEPLHPDTVAELRVVYDLAQAHEWEKIEGRHRNDDPTYECPRCERSKDEGHKSSCLLKEAIINIRLFLDMQEEANDKLERYASV